MAQHTSGALLFRASISLRVKGDHMGNAITGDTQANGGAVRPPHKAAQFGVANGRGNSTVNLHDRSPTLIPSAAVREADGDGLDIGLGV